MVIDFPRTEPKKKVRKIKITNKYNLPQAIVNAVVNDPYDSSGSDISTTQLIKPPRIRILQDRNADLIKEDVSDRIFSLVGQNTHHIIERACTINDVAEKRLFYRINNWTLSGQLDLLTSNNELIDFKVTSVWTAMDALKSEKSEWEQQLNILDFLCSKNSKELIANDKQLNPDTLNILAILRDWSKLKSYQSKEYPKQQVVMIPVRKWSQKEQEEFIISRVQLHQSSEHMDNAPVCTPQERWQKKDTYRVLKDGRKTALRVLDNENQVAQYLKEKDLVDKKGIQVVLAKGEETRCLHYCNVNQFCNYYLSLEGK